ncbi:hypothetical protein B597_009185 [Stutzerimonas stutzeri KOS6]|uniref:Uncharacterized protein n=1 Tax=Stutzerimonas stutzeri KOS6 TaxID=1218352 RepID=A0A061JPD5_STUST|nr:hypothetical protein B597_009185 [Stutzerimonas stutzeri KOS6]
MRAASACRTGNGQALRDEALGSLVPAKRLFQWVRAGVQATGAGGG